MNQNISLPQLQKRYRRLMVAFAAGDALGLPTELIKSQEQLQKRWKVDTVTDFLTEPGHRRGIYSDDTQQSLAVARSIQPGGQFDAAYFTKQEIKLWDEYAKGQGYTSQVSSRNLSGKAQWYSNFYYQEIKDRLGNPRIIDYRTAQSNGTVMRVAPLALANLYDKEQMEREVWRCSISTHGHPGAALAALLQAETLRSLLVEKFSADKLVAHLQKYLLSRKLPTGDKFKEWHQTWNQNPTTSLEYQFSASKAELLHGLKDIAELINNKSTWEQFVNDWRLCQSPDKTNAVPTYLGSLALALNCDDVAETVLKAVNLYGSDTDTLAAISGIVKAAQIETPLPAHWQTVVQDGDYLKQVADDLAAVAGGKANQSPGAVQFDTELPDLLDQLALENLTKTMRVNHKLLGAGTVTDSWQYQAGKKQTPPGPWLNFAWVDFDHGQSCQFKTIVTTGGEA